VRVGRLHSYLSVVSRSSCVLTLVKSAILWVLVVPSRGQRFDGCAGLAGASSACRRRGQYEQLGATFFSLTSFYVRMYRESKHALSSEEEVLAFGAQQRSELETRVTDYD
jgi:hypothetical protein